MLSGLLECFASVEFCLFFLSNILQRVLEHFSPSLFHLILKQIFAVSDCLLSPWCNFCCKFPIICLNFGLKFSIKILIPYLSQNILILSRTGLQVLETHGTCFFSTRFSIFQRVTCGGEVLFHIFNLKNRLSFEEKVDLSEKQL